MFRANPIESLRLRPIHLILPAVIAGALALGGCAASSTPPSPSPTGALSQVTWEGDCAKDTPKLSFKAPLKLGSVASLQVKVGTGDKISAGQKVLVRYVALDAETGSAMFDGFADNVAPQPVQLPNDGASAAAGDPFSAAFVGQKVGACLLMALPDAQGASGKASGLVLGMRIESAKSVPAKAEGETMPQEDPKLPQVTLDKDGKPAIKLPDAVPAPTELVVTDLIKGTGAQVKEGDQVTVKYTGWLWDGGKQFDSAWDRGEPATFTLAPGGLIDGWVEGLVGKTVGSQVLLVVPPAKGYKDKEQGEVPANSTLVFVVDILDIG